MPEDTENGVSVIHKREDAADRRRQQHAKHGDEGKFEIAVEHEQQHEDQYQRQRQNHIHLRARGGVFLVLTAPIQAIALRQADLVVDLLMASCTAPARSRPVTENCTPM